MHYITEKPKDIYYITALPKIYKPDEVHVLQYTWEKLAQFITQPRKISSKKELPVWSPTSFEVNKRPTNDTAMFVSLAVIDVDDGTPYKFHQKFDDFQYIAHTTSSHRDDHHKWRLIIPFSQPVDVDRKDIDIDIWKYVWKQIRRLWEKRTGKKMDESCKDSRRFYYLPQFSYTYLFDVNSKGQTFFVDEDEIQQMYEEEQLERMERLERLEQRRNEMKNRPMYLRNESEELRINLIVDKSYRETMCHKIGGKIVGTGPNRRAEGWSCPSCHRTDATYYYIETQFHRSTAQCGHMNSCGQWWTLFDLGREKGVC